MAIHVLQICGDVVSVHEDRDHENLLVVGHRSGRGFFARLDTDGSIISETEFGPDSPGWIELRGACVTSRGFLCYGQESSLYIQTYVGLIDRDGRLVKQREGLEGEHETLRFLGAARRPNSGDVALVGWTDKRGIRNSDPTLGLVYILDEDLNSSSRSTLRFVERSTGVEVIEAGQSSSKGDSSSGDSWNVAGWTFGDSDDSFWATVRDAAPREVARR
ncbi:MAG: hypothetical protein AAF517_26665 [Planctomycetota bacterium]